MKSALQEPELKLVRTRSNEVLHWLLAWVSHCDQCESCRKFNNLKDVPACSEGKEVWDKLVNVTLTGELFP
jgi:hypothetical protein